MIYIGQQKIREKMGTTPKHYHGREIFTRFLELNEVLTESKYIYFVVTFIILDNS